MHTFAVVNVRRGLPIPDHVRQILSASAPADLTFPPDDHVHWSDPTGALHFAGWQAGGEHLGVGSRWDVRPSGVTAFSGHTWLDTEPWKDGTSWAAQLADRLVDADIQEVATRLDGVFNLVHLTRDGRGAVTSDPLGIGLLYQGRNDRISVYSNRAALVARLIAPAGAEPQRDVEGVIGLAYANNLQTERTTFAGVTVVPRASVIELNVASHPRTRVWATAPWIDPDLSGAAPSPELFAPAVDHMRGLVRIMASLPTRQRTLELTGGRDSRMILGLLLAEGVADRFTYITWGAADLPDVVVAGQLADRYDLDLRAHGRERKRRPRTGGGTTPGALGPRATGTRTAPQPEPLGFDEEMRRHVWRTSGAISIWDVSTNGRNPSPNIALTGQFGELLRTNYPRTSGIASMADMDSFVRAGLFGFDAAQLMRPSVRRRHDDRVIGILHDLLPAGGTAQDAIDAFNQVARLRRWFGTSHELDNRNRLFPLYSMPATQAAFAIGSHLRRLEALPFEVIRATCPELATMPFAPSAWPESLVREMADGHRYPTSPDVPTWNPPSRRARYVRRGPRLSRQAAPKLAAVQRTMQDIDRKIPILREYLDLGPTHDLYRYLDYDATMQAVTDLPELDFLARRSVHDAVTAAMWLGGAETPETF